MHLSADTKKNPAYLGFFENARKYKSIPKCSLLIIPPFFLHADAWKLNLWNMLIAYNAETKGEKNL